MNLYFKTTEYHLNLEVYNITPREEYVGVKTLALLPRRKIRQISSHKDVYISEF
jgi:hypothetical protein